MLPSLKDIAVKAAKKAGKLLKENLNKEKKIEFKGAVDLVTELDRASEALIIDILKSGFPESGILTEEREEIVASNDYRWIVDPLDGTTNYAHSYPVFCVSIALEKKGDVILGVVYDPTSEELFVAEKERGATLNGEEIIVSRTSDLSRSLLSTGFPYDIRTSPDNNLNFFASFAMKAQAIRRAGSAALDLCYVACGRFDGFWELKLKPWDVAAGNLMITEAGGKVSDFAGAPLSLYAKETLASNGFLHEIMIDVLANKR